MFYENRPIDKQEARGYIEKRPTSTAEKYKFPGLVWFLLKLINHKAPLLV